jgi:hypothetical protein
MRVPRTNNKDECSDTPGKIATICGRAKSTAVRITLPIIPPKWFNFLLPVYKVC